MKHTVTMMICAAAGLMACRQPAKGKVPTFLPGIYVTYSENEFCRIDDTLIIHKAKLDGDEYSVTRRSSFVRLHGGRRNLGERQMEAWDARFDPDRQTLRSSGQGKDLLYSEESNRVYIDRWVYEKVE